MILPKPIHPIPGTMKLFFLFVALHVASGIALADEESFRAALMELPPKYLADVPLADRQKLIATAGKNADRLNAATGWLHWYSDGSSVRASSMIWAKELPRPDKTPLILVHMAKPFADGRKPEEDHTVVLERGENGWKDVTKEVMPADVDMKMHFRTREDDTVVEVAPWKEIDRRDGRGKALVYGSRVMDLHWSGERFIAKEPESKVLTKN